MTHRTGFHDGRLGIGLEINGGGDGSGKPRYPLDINGDIRLSGAIVDSSGNPIQMMAQQRTFPKAITTVEREDIGDGTVFGAGTFKLNGLDTYYNDGNVGIGTTTPGAKLDVSGNVKIRRAHSYVLPISEMASNNGITQFADWVKDINEGRSPHHTNPGWSNPGYRIYVHGSLTNLYNATYGTTGALPGAYNYGSGTYFYASWHVPTQDVLNKILELAQPISAIFKDGNVGIGTASPGEKLHIKMDGLASASGAARNNPLTFKMEQIGWYDYNQIFFAQPNNNYGTYIGHYEIGSAGDDNYFFIDSIYNNVRTQRFCINSSTGNVGIGTTDPGSYKLNVNGNTNITGTLTATTLSGNLPWSNITSAPTTITTAQINDIAANNAKVSSQWTTNSSNIYYNGGNVGIGITGPSGRLHIVGSSGVHALRISGNSGSTAAQIYATGSNYGIRITTAASSGSYYSAHFEGSSGKGLYVRDDGNVGIGTTSPSDRLHVKNGDIYIEEGKIQFAMANRAAGSNANFGISVRFGSYEIPIIHTEDPTGRGHICFQPTNGHDDSSIIFKGYGSSTTWDGTAAFGTERMRIQNNGNVGIGTPSPSMPLHVASYRTGGSWITSTLGNDGAWYGNEEVNLTSGSYSRDWIDSDYDLRTNMWGGDTDPHEWASDSNMKFSGLFDYHLCIDNGHSLLISSDERIKLNITDVPDDLALYKLRRIPCRFYHYRDIYNKGSEPTIGFIAQEVKKHLPIAVTLRPGWVPSVYKRFDNSKISWEEIVDDSNNTSFKLTCENEIRNLINLEVEHLEYYTNNTDISGVFYKFICSNNNDRKTEETIEIIGNMDNTFTFKKKWTTVFCYGHRVNDFHSLDKSKLFALNFSATQEIDRVQQEEVGKLAEQTSKIIELEKKVATLESTLETVLARITELENN